MSNWDVLSVAERIDAHPTRSGAGVCIAFVDLGFYPHPDLMRPTRRVRAYVDVTRDEPIAEEFFTPQPFAWHGTMTACCAAGNGFLSAGRYRGLAHQSEVVLVKVGVEGGRILGKNVASALRLPIRHPELGIRVMNVSLGVNDDDPDARDVERAVEEATRAGVVVVAAAGNTPGKLPEPPGSARFAITVGGTDDKNTREAQDDAPWPSSAGSPRPGVQKPDLLAPAFWLAAPMLPGTLTAREASALFLLRSVLDELSVIQSFARTADDGDDTVENLMTALAARIERSKLISPYYQHVEGTSFAAPITASVIAQMLEADPKLTPAEVREGLLHTARKLAHVPANVQGAGVLSARAAVEWAEKRAAK